MSQTLPGKWVIPEVRPFRCSLQGPQIENVDEAELVAISRRLLQGGNVARLEFRLSGSLSQLTAAFIAMPSGETGPKAHAMLDAVRSAVMEDPDASDVFGYLGGHRALLQLEKKYTKLMDSDGADLAALLFDTIAACGPNFPLEASETLAEQSLETRPLEVVYEPGHRLLVRTLPPRFEAGDKPNFEVGFRLWGAALVLSNYVLTKTLPRCARVLELGAGCGLCGLAYAATLSVASPTRVVLTDFHPDILENLKYNAAINNVQDLCSVKRLDWDKTDEDENEVDEARFDLVLASDVVCQASDVPGLARVLRRTLSPESGVALISLGDSASRFGVEDFVDGMRCAGLEVENITESLAVDPRLLATSGLSDWTECVGSAKGYQTYRVRLCSVG